MKRYRARHNSNPVSSFAFQDIITALAGSMLIIVLVIAYGRSDDRSGATVLSGGNSAEYEHLQELIKLKKQQLATQKQQITQLRSKILEQTAREKAAAEKLAIEQASSTLEKVIVQRKKQRTEILDSIKDLQKKYPSSTDTQLTDLLKEQRDLQKQLRRKRFALQLQSLDHKKTILLDCSQVRWLWNDNRASTDLGNSIEALPKVLRKLKNTDPAKHRLVLAVRPSAGVFADQLRKLLKQEFPALEVAAEPLAAESSAEVLP